MSEPSANGPRGDGAAPAVSVIMPAYNALPHLRAAVESVLNQTFGDFEFLIVNDASTDGTGEALNEYAAADPRVRVLDRGKVGYTAALNLMAAEARGEFLARMDADDVCRPGRLEKQVAFLRANPDCVLTGAAVRLIDDDGDPLWVMRRAEEHEEILAGLLHEPSRSGHVVHPTVLVRAEALGRAGRYDPAEEPAEDLALWFRLADVGRLHNLQDVLLDYRVSSVSVSSTRSDEQRAKSHAIVKAARDRRGLSWPPPVPFAIRSTSPQEQRLQLIDLACRGGHPDVARKHLARLDPAGLPAGRVALARLKARLGPAYPAYRLAERAVLKLGRVAKTLRPRPGGGGQGASP